MHGRLPLDGAAPQMESEHSIAAIWIVSLLDVTRDSGAPNDRLPPSPAPSSSLSVHDLTLRSLEDYGYRGYPVSA